MKVSFSYTPVSYDTFCDIILDCCCETTKEKPYEVIYYNEKSYDNGCKLPQAKMMVRQNYKDTNEYYIAVYK